MAQKAYVISRQEMHKFLMERKFQQITLPNTIELVYGKIVKVGEHKLSLRVYTSIDPRSGKSRPKTGKGSDTIRVQLYFMYDNRPVPVGCSQIVKRITTWENNLHAALGRHADPNYFQICPVCGFPMVERENSKTGEKFWGCVTWKKTGCTGRKQQEKVPQEEILWERDDREWKQQQVRPTKGETPKSEPVLPARRPSQGAIPADMISEHQKAVESAYRSTAENMVIGARAGSGKTKMLEHLACFRRQGQSILLLAFGRKNANVARKRMPREVTSLTTHSFCARFLRDQGYITGQSDENKDWRIMEEVYPAGSFSDKPRKRVRVATFKMIGLAKNHAIKPGDAEGLKAVFDEFNFDLESEGEVQVVLDNTLEVLEMSYPGKSYGSVYTYDDMLWWPVVLDLTPPKYDDVYADECQDLNACQIWLLDRMAANGSRIVAVGDPYQAVYRFRGADTDAYQKVKTMLERTQRGVREFLLPTNYRCGKKILEFVRQKTHVKDILAAPNAADGEVLTTRYDELLDQLCEKFGRKV